MFSLFSSVLFKRIDKINNRIYSNNSILFLFHFYCWIFYFANVVWAEMKIEWITASTYAGDRLTYEMKINLLNLYVDECFLERKKNVFQMEIICISREIILNGFAIKRILRWEFKLKIFINEIGILIYTRILYIFYKNFLMFYYKFFLTLNYLCFIFALVSFYIFERNNLFIFLPKQLICQNILTNTWKLSHIFWSTRNLIN